MRIQYSLFLASVLPVRENAVKNILFRAATIILQFVVYRIFSYLSYRSNAYTSFLMFAEDSLQQLYFIFSRKFNRQALLVLGFAVLTTLAGFYDTLLWALDSPGYVTQSTISSGLSVSHNLLDNPAYITYIANPSGNVENIDSTEAMTSNLFKTGFNFSLPAITDIGTKEVVAPLQNASEAGLRIWLDNEGLSVAVDQTTMITTRSVCPLRTPDEFTQTWRCNFNNTEALDLLNGYTGQPQIWWDLSNDQFLVADRHLDPWNSLGKGGDTAGMKKVFTVTKGRNRHTFLESVFKTTMISLYPTPFAEAEIEDIIKRTWQVDSTQPIDTTTRSLINMVEYAQGNGTTLSFGVNVREQYSVSANTIEFLQVMSLNNTVYTALRITVSNITLVRSEILDEAVIPLQPCAFYYTNIAFGGRVQSTTCYKSLGDQTGARFLGQLDTSAMVILTNVLGDGSSAIAATALNKTGVDWYNDHEAQIDQTLLSRGVMLGGDRGIVEVEVRRNVAALSYLQLFLSLVPILFAILVWLATVFQPMSYYQSSFLAAVLTTTHVVSTPSCKKVGYLKVPPEVSLRHENEHAFIATQTGGTLVHLEPNHVVALAMSMEPYGHNGAEFSPLLTNEK
ncbi:hypothetical protein B0H34DRAFT_67180 [Crassisporium funariophilum]|nr:hypothetical protein B0H34DRAFT_67180 [Crassisporium funariophilum]